jgi:hypothetical protein
LIILKRDVIEVWELADWYNENKHDLGKKVCIEGTIIKSYKNRNMILLWDEKLPSCGYECYAPRSFDLNFGDGTRVKVVGIVKERKYLENKYLQYRADQGIFVPGRMYSLKLVVYIEEIEPLIVNDIVKEFYKDDYLEMVKPDRDYYVGKFGFDPYTELKYDWKMNQLIYCREFQLVSDRKLRESGFTLHTQVSFSYVGLFEKPEFLEFDQSNQSDDQSVFPKCRLVFVKGNKKGFADVIISSGSNEECFVDLCKFTNKIVDVGIEYFIIINRTVVHFTHIERTCNQIINAITKVDSQQGLRMKSLKGKTRNVYLKVAKPDRDYYVGNFGFDPYTELKYESNRLMYYREVPLINDKKLCDAGIKVYVEAKFSADQTNLELGIHFTDGKKTGYVHCIHTGVNIDTERYSKLLEEDITDHSFWLDSRKVMLSPEEHFVALFTYVSGIAEAGIENMIKMGYEVLEYAVGFNAMMQSQIIKAIMSVNSSQGTRILRDTLYYLNRNLTEDEMNGFFPKVVEIYGLNKLARETEDDFQMLLDFFPGHSSHIISSRLIEKYKDVSGFKMDQDYSSHSIYICDLCGKMATNILEMFVPSFEYTSTYITDFLCENCIDRSKRIHLGLAKKHEYIRNNAIIRNFNGKTGQMEGLLNTVFCCPEKISKDSSIYHCAYCNTELVDLFCSRCNVLFTSPPIGTINSDTDEIKSCVYCNCREGDFHKDNCGFELCPSCGGRRLKCNCKVIDDFQYIYYPTMCSGCGKLHPNFFNADDLWDLTEKLGMNDKILCLDCLLKARTGELIPMGFCARCGTPNPTRDLTSISTMHHMYFNDCDKKSCESCYEFIFRLLEGWHFDSGYEITNRKELLKAAEEMGAEPLNLD